MRILVRLPLAVCLVSLMITGLQAQVPDTISFQGVITDLDGVPIDTTETIVVSLYKNGVIVWDDKIAGVEIVDGRFDLAIGGDARFDTVAFNQPMELEIKLGTEAEPAFSPRTPLRSVPYALGLRGIQVIPPISTDDAPSLIAGHPSNTGTGEGATVGGGGFDNGGDDFTNDVTARYGTVAGGLGNSAAEQASVGGGGRNSASGQWSTVSGGILNVAGGSIASIGGGIGNAAAGDRGTIGGGSGNKATGYHSTVGGGHLNEAKTAYATIAGGGPSDPTSASTRNIAYDTYTTIGGGAENRVGTDDADSTDASYATISGGQNNVASGLASAIGGGSYNTASGKSSTIAGGVGNRAEGRFSTVSGGNNAVFDDYGAVGGGDRNFAGTDDADTTSAMFATVGGGQFNDAASGWATVAGGRENRVLGRYATVGGGYGNTVLAKYGTIAGGGPGDSTDVANTRNIVYDIYGTIGGGGNNKAGKLDGGTELQRYATVSGGDRNEASGQSSTVGGGAINVASGWNSVVSGGSFNEASGTNAVVPGGLFNDAFGNYSFASGRGARADHDYTFVWSGTPSGFNSTDTSQFLIEARGGVGINTNAPVNQFHVVDEIDANSTLLSSYVAQVQNTSTGQSADGLAIKLNVAASNSGNDFLGFFDGGGMVGSIQGDGTGVTFQTSGSDYAEYIRRENPGDSFEVGDIVGVFNGRVTAQIGPQHRAMVVTGHPSILGNMPPGRENAPEYEKIAFIGQIPVNVVGPVEAGDYIIPSQDGDGLGVAVRASELDIGDLEHIVGRAWESNRDPGQKKVQIEVGLDHSAATASLLGKQQAEIDSLREIVQRLVAALGTD